MKHIGENEQSFSPFGRFYINVYQCLLTLGVPGCDVDDGLALMYLLGCPEAELLGVTATYGNNKIDVVWETMNRMLSELGQTELRLEKEGQLVEIFKVMRLNFWWIWQTNMQESDRFLQQVP